MDATTVDLVTDAAVRAAHAELERLGAERAHVVVLVDMEPVPEGELHAGVACMRAEPGDPPPDGEWLVEQLLRHAQQVAEATGQAMVFTKAQVGEG